ncbi:PKD domain-containing protein [Mucilaginibacter sp. BT774]|uniref:PKD domain-containing protein n=1 Tax=Mucilaginibacter sp. BT774 TaxID=3062276 RepID=UPI0026745C0D|nr:PKD domain-containing protein [Mucilaginibacter sp. BT774]MDO3628707.1 PKD domain-containing protein [Mucilaginibacter sp. BT774]
MNKTLLILSLFCIVFFSCKKTVTSPTPQAKPKVFALLLDTIYEHEFVFPRIIDTTGSKSETYRWDWGDNTTDTGLHARHEYLAEGNYTIKLTTNGGSTSKKVFVYPGSGSVEFVNASSEPITKIVVNSESQTDAHPVGTLLPGARTGTIFITQLPLFTQCVISGYVGDTTKKTVFFKWGESYLHPYYHDVFTINDHSIVFFRDSYGNFQGTNLSNWMNFSF